MSKKLLSITLALVIVFSSFALSTSVFAAGTADYSAVDSWLAQLPCEEDLRFYTDYAIGVVDAAKAAVVRDLDDQTAVDQMAEGLEAAYDLLYTLDPDDEFGLLYLYRDESKAEINQYLRSTKNVFQPGDEIEITYSIKTNFLLCSIFIPILYDPAVLEIISYDMIDTHYQITANTTDMTYLYPESWTAQQKADNMVAYLMFTYTNEFTPYKYEQETEFATIKFKVKDTAADGASAIYVHDDFLYDWYEDVNIYKIERSSGSNMYAPDEQATFGQQISIENFNFTVGNEADFDYTALQVEIAKGDTLVETDYTAQSWSTYAEAVAVGENLIANGADSQSEIDAMVGIIADAREALVFAQAEGCKITNVVAPDGMYLGVYNTVDVYVEGSPYNIRFIAEDDATSSYSRTSSKVTIEADGDNEIWHIQRKTYANSERYRITPRYNSKDGYLKPYYIFMYECDKPSYLGVISAEIPDSEDNRLLMGRHNVIVTTGKDVDQIQFVSADGGTRTYNATSSAVSIERVGNTKVWTINMNFSYLGRDVMSIRTRASTTSYETSNIGIDVFVLY